MSVVAVKELPLLMSPPMVRATLYDSKTQTRRIVQDRNGVTAEMGDYSVHPAVTSIEPNGDGTFRFVGHPEGRKIYVSTFPLHSLRFPYGKPGERLWVRERWNVSGLAFGKRPSLAAKIASRQAWKYYATDKQWQHGWKPSIHMPRAASRITLEIVSVRVERLNAISEVDALAEGIIEFTKDGKLKKYWACDPVDDHPPKSLRTTWADMPRTAVEAYAALWNSINGPGAWQLNPWVWVISFKRLEQTA